jgi:hypothetical protein
VSDGLSDAEIRDVLAMMLVKGHAVYHPDDLELPPDDRRLILTEEGEREAERLLGLSGPPIP